MCYFLRMRAKGRDISELFGFPPNDSSAESKYYWTNKKCPFTSLTCSKTNHDKSEIYGVCSVSKGIEKEQVVVCPKRLYAKNYDILKKVSSLTWTKSDFDLIVGGNVSELKKVALGSKNPVIAFGQNSGREIQFNSNGQMSMDWVLQQYEFDSDKKLVPKQFVGVEVQSIDITGNYRKNWSAYKAIKEGSKIRSIPDSEHGLNWANVHKRLIPQIIRKGNVYRASERCAGFFFILPDIVFQKFEEIIGDLKLREAPDKNNLSVMTFSVGEQARDGDVKELLEVRTLHYNLSEVANAFISSTTSDAPKNLDQILKNII